MRLQVAAAVAGIMLCCCANVVALELLLAADGGCGVLLTAAQFLAVAAYAMPSCLQWSARMPRLAPRNVPLLHYLGLVALFLGGSLLNNMAFHFRISLPLHSLFRSGSLVANVALGAALGKRYARTELLSVAAVTVGVVCATLASLEPSAAAEHAVDGLTQQTIGICILAVALLLSTSLSLYQEHIFRTYRSATREEFIFYTHALALPLFILMAPQLWETILRWSEPESMADLLYGIPRRPLLLLINVVTQIGCISSVYHLIHRTSALTLQLALSLRKFVSLLFSVAYFGHAVTAHHWTGVALVFGGSLLYSWSKSRAQEERPKQA